MSEHDVQVAFFRRAAYSHLPDLEFMHAIPNGGQRSAKVGAYMKAEGTKSGVWDVFLPVPNESYHGMYIEFKFGKNSLTESQIAFREYIEKCGYYTIVAYNWQEAWNEVMNYLGLEPD